MLVLALGWLKRLCNRELPLTSPTASSSSSLRNQCARGMPRSARCAEPREQPTRSRKAAMLVFKLLFSVHI